MQGEFNRSNKQVVITAVLAIVKTLVVHYLPNNFFYPAPHSVKNPVVPSFEGEAASRALMVWYYLTSQVGAIES